MNEYTSDLNRRRFLQAGLLAAGPAALAPAVSRAAESGLPTRKFGKTGRTLPVLGMGGSAMVQMWTASYGVKLLPYEERVAMVRHAFDRGVRYFDTARVYGESESIV